jgi:6-phosphogluconate dehydrogenase
MQVPLTRSLVTNCYNLISFGVRSAWQKGCILYYQEKEKQMTGKEQKIVDVLMDDMLGGIAKKYSEFMDTVIANTDTNNIPHISIMLAMTDYYQNLIDGNVN